MQPDFPIFQTERLVLKAITSKDADAYSKHFIDYNVIRYLSSVVPWPYPENGVEDFLKTTVFPYQGKDKWVWGIFLKENPDELIGCIDLWRKGKPENRGFWLGKKYWGKGIMTEANYPILDYAFKHLRFEKLIFANAVSNIASRRIKEKTGCRLIGIEPASFVDPEFKEHELWELTSKDWENHKEDSNRI
jgi:RimJ/RimL family protein N-acetyltransferase